MQSFLVDNFCFLGGDRFQPLAQGNQPPIAVDDPFTVIRGAGPVSIAVLDNDVDPEGQPLTVVSAFAALGIAVVEADNTVTYTPPDAGAVTSDTVVYEIADVEDARSTGQIDITITDPVVAITTLANETFEVSASLLAIDITVIDPPEFAGIYTVDLAALATGPVNLVPPAVSGTVAAGQVLSAAEGLWIYDSTAGNPARDWQWQAGGSDIPGATATSYTVQPADVGQGVGVVETLTDANGSRSVSSTGSESFAPSTDLALIDWWDAADGATITESAGAVSDWANKAAGPALVQTNGARQPTTGVRTLNGLNVIDFDGGDFLDQDIALPGSGDVAFHMVLEIDSTANEFEAVLAVDAVNDFQIDAGNATQFDGRLSAAGIAAASTAFSGGPFVGLTFLSIICDFTGAGTIEVFVNGVLRASTAYTGPLDDAVDLRVMTNRANNARANGAVAELIVTGSTENRAEYHTYLTAKWGP